MPSLRVSECVRVSWLCAYVCSCVDLFSILELRWLVGKVDGSGTRVSGVKLWDFLTLLKHSPFECVDVAWGPHRLVSEMELCYVCVISQLMCNMWYHMHGYKKAAHIAIWQSHRIMFDLDKSNVTLVFLGSASLCYKNVSEILMQIFGLRHLDSKKSVQSCLLLACIVSLWPPLSVVCIVLEQTFQQCGS